MAIADSPRLLDQRGRPLTELRLSVTDRCNYRCRYCMPRESVREASFIERKEQLEFDELQRQWRLLMADICNGRIKGDGAAGETDYLACKLTALIQHCR